MAISTKSGVYKILNTTNKKFYIGSSIDVYSRIIRHKVSLRKGSHHSKHLQKSWNKYKEDSFSFEVLEYCSPNDCIKKEQYWIDFYKSYIPENGYNTVKFAGNTLGYKHTIESKIKISKFYKERWNNMTESEKLIESENKAILRRGKKITPEHYKALKDGWDKANVPNNKKRIEATKAANFENSWPVLQFSKNGEFIKEFRNSRIAVESLDLSSEKYVSLSRVCVGKRKTAYGFIWKYKKDIK